VASLLARSQQEPAHSASLNLANALSALAKGAVVHHQAGRYAEAIRLYERILAVKADFPEIHNNWGHALSALGAHGECGASPQADPSGLGRALAQI